MAMSNLLCLALLAIAAAGASAQSPQGSTQGGAQASSTTQGPTTTGRLVTGGGEFPQTDPVPTTAVPCIEGDTCVKGPCHLHASCAGDRCIYINADDGNGCQDRDGFNGKCSAGVCEVARFAAIKSFGDNLVVHTPNGGDLLFASADLGEDISLRGIDGQLADTRDNVVSMHERANDIEAKAEAAEINHNQLVSRVNAIDADVKAQLLETTAYAGTIETKADTNAQQLEVAFDSVEANAGDIGKLQDKTVALDGQLAELDSDKASRDELADAVSDLEKQVQAEDADIRTLQAELATKVITLTDDTTEHNEFIIAMQQNIATLGGRIDSNDGDITNLQQTRLTQAQVESLITAKLTPVDDRLTAATTKLRTDLDAIDLEPLEKKIERNTILARAGAGLAPGKTATDSEAYAAAGKFCGNRNQALDQDTFKCKDCASGFVDQEFGRCHDSGPVSVTMEEDIEQTSCSTKTWDALFGNGITIDVPKTGKYEITVVYDSQMDTTCTTGNYISPYIMIDGSTYQCMYAYLYQTPSSSSWGLYDSRRPLYCKIQFDLAAGAHVINSRINSGYKFKIYKELSTLSVRPLGTISPNPQVETGTCNGQTSQTQVSTNMNSGPSYYCGSSYYLDSYTAQRGPFSITSRTGRIHVTFNARLYLYPYRCTSESYFEMRIYVNNAYRGVASYNSARNHYSREYTYDNLVTDFFLDVPSSAQIRFYIRNSGYYSNVFGNQYYSSVRIEDVPKETRTPSAAALPTGCKGTPRRFLLQSHIASSSTLTNSDSRTLSIYDLTASRTASSLDFRVLRDQTRVRLYIKADAYLQNNGVANSAVTQASLVPYFNNKAYPACIRRSRIYTSSRTEREEGPIVCDYNVVLDKGDITFKLVHVSEGQSTTIRNTQLRSIISIEELVHS